MRIVGGSLGGRVLRAPTGAATRPTSEKVREAMFAILGSVEGMHVLDLFAGSGAVGIEALSRGAAHAVLNDNAKPAQLAIRANVDKLGVADRTSVLATDALRLARTPPVVAPYGLVFIDPPYASELAVRATEAISLGNLAADATVVIEHDLRHAPPEQLGSLLRTDHRRYGDTQLSFYKAPQ
ncbi:MAG TPA: 16S rRNA (guanine(966)-N(2))-methyltransferase RsmD [Kofleriaceae bacterium]|jgi:16S rRNA (guanine966-N2)-methyltransferase